MTQPVKRTFKNKIFYFDLRRYRNEADLAKTLKRLGAKVESFLSRDIDYVVTDKENPKLKHDGWTPITPKSLAFDSPSPRRLNDSLLGSPFDNSRNTSSPQNECRTPILSRGLALVQKAKQRNDGCTDLVSICRQWNIKIIPIQKFLSVISKLNLPPCRRNDENKTPSEKFINRCEETLRSPFVKIEDNKCIYKPQIKTFDSGWKHAVDKDLLKHVNNLQSSLKKNVKPLGVNQSLNIVPITVAKSLPPPLPKMTFTPTISKTTPVHFFKETPNFHKTNSLVRAMKVTCDKNVLVAKKHYCEICCCSFDDINKHLQSNYHSRFQNNPSNFKEIAKIMTSLPNTCDFMRSHEAQKVEECTIVRDEQVTQSLDDMDAMTELLSGFGNNDILYASCRSYDSVSEFPYLEGTANSTKRYPNLMANSDEIVCTVGSMKWKQSADSITEVLPDSESYRKSKGATSLHNKSIYGTHTTQNFLDAMVCDLPPIAPMIESAHLEVPNVDLLTENDRVLCKGIQATTNLPNDTLLPNGCFVRRFPFRNFGFGWTSDKECDTIPDNSVNFPPSSTWNGNASYNVDEDGMTWGEMQQAMPSDSRVADDNVVLDLTVKKFCPVSAVATSETQSLV